MRLIAIDPGASGGIAWTGSDDTVQVQGMPDTETDIVQCLRSVAAIDRGQTCYLERVQGCMGPGLPGSAMFTFGANYGLIRGALIAMGVRIAEVRPQDWQKGLHLGTRAKDMPKHEWKNKLKAQAQLLFPTIDVTLKTADALLIYEYARRENQKA